MTSSTRTSEREMVHCYFQKALLWHAPLLLSIATRRPSLCDGIRNRQTALFVLSCIQAQRLVPIVSILAAPQQQHSRRTDWRTAERIQTNGRERKRGREVNTRKRVCTHTRTVVLHARKGKLTHLYIKLTVSSCLSQQRVFNLIFVKRNWGTS